MRDQGYGNASFFVSKWAGMFSSLRCVSNLQQLLCVNFCVSRFEALSKEMPEEKRSDAHEFLSLFITRLRLEHIKRQYPTDVE